MVVEQKLPASKSSGPPWRLILIGVGVALLLVIAIFTLYPGV
jgi:hypothetical protein